MRNSVFTNLTNRGLALVAVALFFSGLVASGAARADQAYLGAIIGGTTGALVGDSMGGRDGAIIGGVLGAVAGAAITRAHYQPPVAYLPPPVYFRPPVEYLPPPTYYAPPRVIVPAPVYFPREHHWDHRRWEHRHEHGGYWDRDGYRR
ncbi:MAG: glycine zipper 2TM domain-containing protein [Betaproteobacteria bacterium]|nr:glycine zipper 2TM domain-containing protein [Betaproteobacteria bacterium]